MLVLRRIRCGSSHAGHPEELHIPLSKALHSLQKRAAFSLPGRSLSVAHPLVKSSALTFAEYSTAPCEVLHVYLCKPSLDMSPCASPFWTRLLVQAHSGHVSLCKPLLDTSPCASPCWTRLLVQAHSGHVSLCKPMLDTSPCASPFWTRLLVQAHAGHISLCKPILDTSPCASPFWARLLVQAHAGHVSLCKPMLRAALLTDA